MRLETFARGVAAALVLLLVAVPARAQIEDQPGYFPLELFDLVDAGDLSVEINLSGALLGVIAAAVGEEDPAFSELVSGLEGIRVRVGEPDELDFDAVKARFAEATDWLGSKGWETLVRVREDGEEINVYTKLDGEEIVGITVLILDPLGEVVVVNVVGTVNLALLASLANTLDLPQLDVVGVASSDEDADSGEDQ